MKKLISALISLVFFGFVGKAQHGDSFLVSPQWLSEKLNDDNLVIFDIDNEKSYNKEHIPGAQLLTWKEYTYDDETHVFDLPTDEVLRDLFQSKGLDDDDIVVLYVQGNLIPMMTRVYFTLDYLGFAKNTYLLDGGMAEWKAFGGKTTDVVPEIKQGSFTINPNKNLLANKEYVKENLTNPDVNIIDGRASVFYQGIEAGNGGKSRKGHIPGAKTVPYTSLYQKNENGAITFVSPDEMQKIFNEQGLQKDKQLVLYCHIGMQLTTVYTAAKLLGFKNVKVYDDSFYQWGPDVLLPIELTD